MGTPPYSGVPLSSVTAASDAAGSAPGESHRGRRRTDAGREKAVGLPDVPVHGSPVHVEMVGWDRVGDAPAGHTCAASNGRRPECGADDAHRQVWTATARTSVPDPSGALVRKARRRLVARLLSGMRGRAVTVPGCASSPRVMRIRRRVEFHVKHALPHGQVCRPAGSAAMPARGLPRSS